MKIIQIINSLESGGAEKLLLDTIPIYRKKGIEVDLLLLNGSSNPFLDKLKDLGSCSIYSLGIGSVYNPLLIFKIVPFLKRYDIAHVHLFPSQYWVVLAKFLSFSKIQLIYTEHSTSSRRVRNKLFKFLDFLFYKPYSKVICISQKVMEVVKEQTSIPDSKIEIITNGVSIEQIKKCKPHNRFDFFPNADSNLKLLIQVSGFKEPKDQSTLIRALSLLSDEVKLVLAGEGNLLEHCIELAKELNVFDRVLFLGMRMDVPQLLKMCDIVVLSSAYEGLSLSSIEGMVSGKPFVATNVPGLSDIVGGAGVLFNFGDEKELAFIIKKLLSDQLYYQETVNLCQIRAEQFDIQIMVNKHLDIYHKLFPK